MLSRWLKITFVFFKYFVFYPLNSSKHLGLGERLSLACQDLGPVFIKLGQVLSTRYDILSKKDLQALQKLLDDVDPIAFDKVVAIFKSDFGQDPRELYREFSEIPLAAASIAQVHKAITWQGDIVAVKVRRPNVARNVKSDVAILKRLISVAQIFSADLRHIGVPKILNQLESWIIAETDFRQEVKNLHKVSSFYLQRAARGEEFANALVWPKVYPRLCSNNVITMEFLDGIPAAKFNAETAGPEYDALSSLTAALGSHTKGYLDREEFIFHADPHPANIFILKHGKAAAVDYGIIGVFSREEAQRMADLVMAVYTKDLNSAVNNLLAMSHASSKFDTPGLRRDLQDFIDKSDSAGFGFWLMEPVRILVKNRVPFPYNMMLFARSSLMMDGLFESVVPGKKTLDVIGPTLRANLYRRALENILDADWGRVLYAISEQFKKSPGLLTGLIQRYLDHPLEFMKIIKEAFSTE